MQKFGQSIKLDRKSFIQKLDLITDHYEVAPKRMARGAYGTVHLCRHKLTQSQRAVKIIPRQKVADVTGFLQEIEALRLLVRSLDYPRTTPTS
jgi:hypothetical protein